MHSGYEIPGIQHQQAGENTCAPVLLSTNQTHIIDQIHSLPTAQQLFLDQHHFFLPPHHQQNRMSHHYLGGGASTSAAYFPVNFKLGLNEICTRNGYKDGVVSSAIRDGGDALLRGSQQCEVPEARHSSLGMLHCWQNQEDPAIKQQTLWEPLPAEVSNENSEIVDRQEHLEMGQKEAPTNCLESKHRVHFGELEAIYKRLGAAASNQTVPSEIHPVDVRLPAGLDHGSEASIGEEGSASMKNARKKRKKKKLETSYDHLINPMMEFFGNLVTQVMDHQENIHRKFTDVMERLDEERRARDEAWRNQESAHFEQAAAARAREKASAEDREAMIVAYLEKITGQRIDLPTFNSTGIAFTSSSDDFRGIDGAREGLKLKPPGCE